MLRKLPLLIFISCFLSGCVQYSLVSPGPVKARDISVTTEIPWNKAPALAEPGSKTELWTADGPLLNGVIFFSGIEDGKSLFKQRSPKDPMPTFSKDMLPHEVMSLIESSLTKYLGAGEVLVKSKNLKPATVSGGPGFRFNLEYYNADGLAFKSDLLCAVNEEKLYAVMYTGTKLHYYDKYKPEVERIFNSVTF